MKIGRNAQCPCGSDKKYKKCHLITPMQYDLVSLESAKYCVAIKENGVAYDIFNIIFHTKADRSSAFMAVSLPNFYKTTGLVNKLTIPGNKRRLAKLSLIPGGKVTTHIVKYTHWLDGNTHFSQDEKIKTTMKNRSDRLDSSIGHVFTIAVKGLKGFRKRDETKKRYDEKRIDLEFDAGTATPASVKFVAYWYHKSVVHLTAPPEKKGGYIMLHRDGSKENCWAISPPSSSLLADYVLLVTGQQVPDITREKGSRFSFMGGFDEKNVRENPANDLHLLICTYPARNYRKLLEKIGSIDWLPETPTLGSTPLM